MVTGCRAGEQLPQLQARSGPEDLLQPVVHLAQEPLQQGLVHLTAGAVPVEHHPGPRPAAPGDMQPELFLQVVILQRVAQARGASASSASWTSCGVSSSSRTWFWLSAST